MKEQKLANSLGISLEEARALMTKYMGTWPAIGRFFKQTEDYLSRTGYSYTFGGRRRYLPAIRSPRPYERFRAGRQGANAAIQGTAAEIAKCAMLRAHYESSLRNLGWRMLLQVHDEIIFEGPIDSVEQAKAVVKDTMEHPFAPWGVEFAAPLQATPASGLSWWACK